MATKKKKPNRRVIPDNPKVVHIHQHSIYSQSDAMAKPEDLAKRAVEIGIDTLVLTDHGNISGVIQLKKFCKKYGIKFIPGCEMYEAKDRLIKDSLKKKNKEVEAEQDEHKSGIYHMTMLPLNNAGWAAIQFLLADANTNGFYKKPRTDLNVIQDNDLGKDLLATSGCLAGYVPQLILAGKYQKAKKEAQRRASIFGAYFLEVQDNGCREQEIVNQQLIQMSKETGIPLVYAKDVHYVRAEDACSHHTLVAIGRKQTIYECSPYPGTNTYHLASAEEVYQWAIDNNIPFSAIENTIKIGQMCNVDIELGKDLTPEYPFCEAGHTDASYLKKLMYDYLIKYTNKLKKKCRRINLKDYIYRTEMEYRVVTMKKFPSYFLILWDLLLWATKRDEWLEIEANKVWVKMPENAKYACYPNYIIGPGRGSAAGSMIAFLLGITKLDPIEYGFMFERFLNPYRNSPPDIDTDFPGDNHDMMLDFVAQRYGRDRVAQILTYTKLKLRSSIDKICKALEKRDPNNPKKVLEYGYAVADEIKKVLEITGDQAKMPDQSDCSYKKMMEIAEKPHEYEAYGPELPKYVEASKEFRKLMLKYPELHERLEKIEGTIDTSGIHPGGVIISKRPLALDCPTTLPREKSKAVLPITMYDYPDCEEIGLLKLDLLRTATLRIISMAIDLIRETTGELIDMYEMDREDPAVFELISRGETHGLFQINGRGITAYTKQVKPKNQREIIDILALFRPGPLDAKLESGVTIADQYVLNGSRNPKEYMKEVHKSLRKYLGETRGMTVYQEQIMNIVQEVGGYNLGHADSFRRVIGKKKIEEVSKLYDEFIFGHKYVLKKWEKFLLDFDSMKQVYDKDDKDKQTPLIEIKSKFDGKIAKLSKKYIENAIKETKEAMAAFEIPGAVNLGYSEKFSHQLFEMMAKFAGYAFNKPHSGCYADETYQTAWLKAHYPVQFMTSLLSIKAEGSDAKNKTLDNLKEVKRMGIRILQPDINKSLREFYPEGDGIRYGLLSIADVGTGVVDQIMEVRDDGGPFKDFNDFVIRNTFKGSKVTRTHYRALIKAGAFDCFVKNRYKLLNHYNFTIHKDKDWTGTEKDLSSDSKKSNHSVRYQEKEFTEKKALEMERELIGIYVSGSPYEDLPFTSMSEMKLSSRRNKKYYDLGGSITNVKVIKTKTGKPMAFVQLETQLEPMEITFFPESYEECSHELYKSNIVVIRGYKEEGYYKGETKESFIGDKLLKKQAKKLKKELGIDTDPPLKPLDASEESLVAKAEEKRIKKADPLMSQMEDRDKGRKKRKDKNDPSAYDEEGDDVA